MSDFTASSVLLSGGLSLADVSDAVGGLSWEFAVGQVAQFSFPLVDADRAVSRRGLLRAGHTVMVDGQRWDVAAVDRDYRGGDVWCTFECRSRLARRLRMMTGPDTQKDVTPGEWIIRKVRKAGGSAVVERGAKRRTVVQKRSEGVTDVIASMASETGVEWVEFDNRMFVGTPWWAFQGETGLPTWSAWATGGGPEGVLRSLDAVSFQSRESLDDRKAAAEATLTVGPGVGRWVRPWHRVDVGRCDAPDEGVWLVTGVSFDESSDVSVSLSRPLKSSPKKGSTGGTGTGDGGELPDLGPIAGSSYRDAQRPAGWRGATVESMVARFKANPGGLGYTINNGCLWYAQELGGYTHQYDNPEQAASLLGSRLNRTKTVVPGAVMLFSNSNIGHAVAYIGGGRCIGTDMDSTGRFTPGKWAIASVDAMMRGFGCSYLGWYAP